MLFFFFPFFNFNFNFNFLIYLHIIFLEDTRHFINFSPLEVNIWSDFCEPSVQ